MCVVHNNFLPLFRTTEQAKAGRKKAVEKKVVASAENSKTPVKKVRAPKA